MLYVIRLSDVIPLFGICRSKEARGICDVRRVIDVCLSLRHRGRNDCRLRQALRHRCAACCRGKVLIFRKSRNTRAAMYRVLSFALAGRLSEILGSILIGNETSDTL